MKTRSRIDGDFYPGIVISIACAVGDERIIAARFIVRGSKQRIVKRFGTCSGITAHRIAVEVIECADGGEGDLPAFGGRRVDVIKVIKVKRVLWFAQYGKSIAFFDGLRLGAKPDEGDKQQQYARDH